MGNVVMETRLQALRALLKARELDAALLSLYENRRYFSGFTGSNGYLLITQEAQVLVTDRRYTQQAREQTYGVHIVEHAADRFALIAQEAARLGIGSLLVESQMPAGEYFAMQENLRGISMVLAEDAFVAMRMVKCDAEVQAIRTAVQLSQAALAEVAAQCKAGMTEKDLADELNYRVSRKGAQAMSFGTIVAAGERGALAHGTPPTRVIAPGEMVVVDLGAQWDGYCADLTRTLLFGDVPQERLAVFDLVERAFAAAVAAVKPGVTGGDVEQAHRAVFQTAGMEAYALKGLGHGIGLEIHEHPRIVIGNQQVLQPGMVFTIEPGLYLPGRFGVRTEDDVLVTAQGVENLCSLPHRIAIA